ncbi:MAG: very short patch repair endonuclease [Spirochaetaceae bacterium]|jgi:DNA mismatch endonuclease (patch repair protein)|nr:very short patch repair endonuclease [Spirochaetaceae bacterium]
MKDKMPDRFSAEKRSEIMSHIRSVDTKPEVFFRKALWKWGVRYRKNVKMFGRPDIAIKKYALAIFIDGDFWHGNNWKIKRRPSLEAELERYSEYWQKKIRRNMARDIEVNAHYRNNGWTVLRFWQSDIEKDLNGCIIKTIQAIDKKKHCRLSPFQNCQRP